MTGREGGREGDNDSERGSERGKDRLHPHVPSAKTPNCPLKRATR